MKTIHSRLLPALLWIAGTAQAKADAIQFPGAAYINGTNVVSFPDPDEALISSVSDGFLTIGFSSLLRASTVGDD